MAIVDVDPKDSTEHERNETLVATEDELQAKQKEGNVELFVERVGCDI